MMTSNQKYNANISAMGDYSELKKIRDFVLKSALTYGFSENEAQKIVLAVDEACSNLIRHSFDFDSNKNIVIQIETADNNFVVNILDEGAPFNPLEAETPDMKEYFKQLKKGGLGIHIMRSVMDDIHYYPSSNNSNQNILKLQKHLPNS